MPIPNRRFIIRTINKHVEEEDKRVKTARGIQDADRTTNPVFKVPDHVSKGKKPDFSSKVKKGK